MQASAAVKAVVAIAEDHADLARNLALLIDQQADLRCAGTAGDRAAVLALFAQNTLDACLLDLWLADGSSLSLIPTLIAQQPQCIIVVTTGTTDPALQRECLSAGAAAVMLKDGRIDHLLQQLRSLLAQRAASQVQGLM
jgi:two-component system response regulator DesR